MQIDKIYEPQRFEPHWSRWWIDRGIFHANAKAGGRVFSLVIPPPNVTGSLHMGHMLEHTEIDVVTRWHRMRGDNTLWLPGTDHAGIATQMVVAPTRPETMLGDTAVAINETDSRYFDLHGNTVQLPLMNRTIPIVVDDLADPEFGTGVVKVTPAHDPNDFECGKRQNLPKIKV